MSEVHLGPTVEEAAMSRLRAIDDEINRLTEERRWVTRRWKQYKGSAKLEAERIADMAEPFQTTPLWTS